MRVMRGLKEHFEKLRLMEMKIFRLSLLKLLKEPKSQEQNKQTMKESVHSIDTRRMRMLFSQFGTRKHFTYIGTVASQHRSFSLFTRRQTEQSSEPVQLSFRINELRL